MILADFGWSEALSVVAILTSVSSLVWSIYIGSQDRAEVVATSRILRGESGEVYGLEIMATNAGRRPIILRALVTYFDSEWQTNYLNERGVRLDEREFFRLELLAGDSYTFSPDGNEATDLFFEDTLGERYDVVRARENLDVFWGRSPS